MSDRLKRCTRCVGVLAVGVLLAFVAAPAQATVVNRGTFAGSDTGVADELCGIALVRDSTFSGSFRDRVDKASGGQAFLERFNLVATDVFTNPATGRSLTFETHELINELTATLVSGNVYEFTSIEAGQPFTLRDSSGSIVLRDVGVLRHRVLFDTLGDGMPGGITLDDQIVRVGGLTGGNVSDEEFCAIVHSLLG